MNASWIERERSLYRRYANFYTTPGFFISLLEDAARLKEVLTAPWLSGALRIGSSAGAPAWWCVGGDDEDAKTLSILVGTDDETWDIALQLPFETIEAVVREVAACAKPTD